MKIFIIASDNINRYNIADEIVKLYNDLDICKTFVGKLNEPQEYTYEMNIDDILLSWKNNVMLFLNYTHEYICGITMDEFYSSDIIPIRNDHFNMIINEIFENHETLIVWVDSKQNTKKDLIEGKYIQERIDNYSLPLLYFCGETDEEIAKIIVDYILADEVTRNEILEENS